MEGGQDAFLGMPMAAAAPPSSLFLGSAATSSGGPQMLSFSSNGVAGLGLSSGASNMHGVLSRVRGPFTPTQWLELEHQALIYKHFAANAPVLSSLLLPIRRSLNPWDTFGSSSLGWAQFRPGCGDAEPGRCRRTDGKKWRCSRDAVGDQRYCDRHINRGRYRSRKHVEGQKATPTIAGPAMAFSTVSNTVAWQQQLKSLAASATNPFARESNRNFQSFPDKQSNVQDHLSVSTSMDSYDFSITHSSPNHEKVALSAVELQHEYVQTYNVHEACILTEKCDVSQESQLLIFRETIDDGPLGEVFRSKTCQPAYAYILTDEWAANCKLHSLTGLPQMNSNLSSVSSSNTVPVDNHKSSDSYLTRRMVDYQTVPTLL